MNLNSIKKLIQIKKTTQSQKKNLILTKRETAINKVKLK